MNREQVAWFPSKVDWWMAAILILVPVIELAICVMIVRSGGIEALAWGLMPVVLVAVLYVLVVWPIRYGITDRELIIRFGVIRRRVPLEKITEVRPTRSPVSSPALSMDRLVIRTKKGFLSQAQISPARREEFLALLAARAGLERKGDRLVRAST